MTIKQYIKIKDLESEVSGLRAELSSSRSARAAVGDILKDVCEEYIVPTLKAPKDEYKISLQMADVMDKDELGYETFNGKRKQTFEVTRSAIEYVWEGLPRVGSSWVATLDSEEEALDFIHLSKLYPKDNEE